MTTGLDLELLVDAINGDRGVLSTWPNNPEIGAPSLKRKPHRGKNGGSVQVRGIAAELSLKRASCTARQVRGVASALDSSSCATAQAHGVETEMSLKRAVRACAAPGPLTDGAVRVVALCQ